MRTAIIIHEAKGGQGTAFPQPAERPLPLRDWLNSKPTRRWWQWPRP